MKRVSTIALTLITCLVVLTIGCEPAATPEGPGQPEGPEEPEDADAILSDQDEYLQAEGDGWQILGTSMEFEPEVIELEEDVLDGYVLEVSVRNTTDNPADILVTAESLENGVRDSAATDEPLPEEAETVLELSFAAEKGDLPPEEGMAIAVELLER